MDIRNDAQTAPGVCVVSFYHLGWPKCQDVMPFLWIPQLAVPQIEMGPHSLPFALSTEQMLVLLE